MRSSTISGGAPTPRAVEELDVLVVDDDLAQAEEIAEFLRGAGFKAMALEDAGDAMGAVIDRRPRLLLMDVNMPICDGVKLAVLVTSIDSTAAIVLMSADASAVERALGAAGVLGVVDKPIELPMLRRVVQAVTGRGCGPRAAADA